MKKILIISFALAITGCDRVDQEAASKLNNKINALEEEITSLKSSLDANQNIDKNTDKDVKIQSNLDSIYSRLFKLESSQNKYDVAELNPATQGYAFVDTNAGRFLISFENITQVGDSSKLNINIGNLLLGNFQNPIVNVTWGSRIPEDISKYPDWYKSLKSTQVKSTQNLLPGRWNNVTIMLPSTHSDQVGYISVSLSVDITSLQK